MRFKFIVVSSITAFVAILSLVNILFASSLGISSPVLPIDRADISAQVEIVNSSSGVAVDLEKPEMPVAVYSETLENVTYSTLYEIFNTSTSESMSSLHVFYGENNEIVGTATFFTDPEQYSLVTVEDYTQAGYSGDVVITADYPFSVSLVVFPTAHFSIESIRGLTVTYTNASVNYDHVLWEFGDGITSTVDSPVHTYEHPGVYTTTLKAVKLDCSGGVPGCVSVYAETFELIVETVFLPIIMTE